MKAPKYPFYFYLILIGLLILSVIFWITIFKSPHNNSNIWFGDTQMEGEVYWSRDYLPDNITQIIPIDTTKIIIDSISQRRIVSNLVNIAVKNSDKSIAHFASDLKEKYPSKEYRIVYIDSVINRLQVQLPDKERMKFKSEIKIKLNKYKLLVWDETLFDYVKTFNDPMLSNTKANWYMKAIDIEKAWGKTTGNINTVIAVIDNGFDLNHPELKNKAVKQYNVIDKSTNVNPNKENHGTHVASTMVGNGNNNAGLVGICPECRFMPIKVQDQNGIMTNTYIIDAILYAIKNKASVINLSLGMLIPPSIDIPIEDQREYIASYAKDEEEFWKDLFKYADEKNITCVLAAGNSNIMTGFDSFQRSESIIKVGAVDNNLSKANFSNFGDQTTIYAPGVDIYGAGPDNGYEFLQGTSMAAPIVSGFIGLMKSLNNKLTNKQIISHLQATAKNAKNIKIFNANLTLKPNL